jgi:hypothetical protein
MIRNFKPISIGQGAIWHTTGCVRLGVIARAVGVTTVPDPLATFPPLAKTNAVILFWIIVNINI